MDRQVSTLPPPPATGPAESAPEQLPFLIEVRDREHAGPIYDLGAQAPPSESRRGESLSVGVFLQGVAVGRGHRQPDELREVPKVSLRTTPQALPAPLSDPRRRLVVWMAGRRTPELESTVPSRLEFPVGVGPEPLHDRGAQVVHQEASSMFRCARSCAGVMEAPLRARPFPCAVASRVHRSRLVAFLNSDSGR